MFSGHAESHPRLVGDIGGTHARFGLITAPGAAISQIVTLRCAEHAGPLEAIRSYLAAQGGIQPRHAAIGIANPITGDELRLTNNPWQFSIRALREALGLGELVFVNDFTALALSLPHLDAAGLQQIGPGQALRGAAIGVIGPGTGLGVSGLVPVKGQYAPIGGEGGHVSLAPYTDEEFAVTALLLREYGHVSAERVLSGPGLLTLHRALARVRGLAEPQLDGATITRQALDNSNALCADTLAMFCALLGSTAGNLALTLGAQGGVFIGGGIVPQLGNYFARSDFRARFEAKGRFATYLATIPTWVITAGNPALTGAAVALQQALNENPPT
ncbi:glucokinase [Uliginosibacterium sp. TH139]|uniref:glucokinase n=1 Tax=Uliginosibacterium sp. TH139 TaxID=2067453 RepID=UPI000C7B12F4|nr:glucokinase [Uliginosibacterium sp. TH139]PLK48535.1 glucokinase [Uliginosibacterium sp. TH139]